MKRYCHIKFISKDKKKIYIRRGGANKMGASATISDERIILDCTYDHSNECETNSLVNIIRCLLEEETGQKFFTIDHIDSDTMFLNELRIYLDNSSGIENLISRLLKILHLIYSTSCNNFERTIAKNLLDLAKLDCVKFKELLHFD